METTDLQNQLMQHTCGLSNGENRNWFGTNKNSKNAIAFEKLVLAGLAVKRNAPSWSGDDVIYLLTEEGKKIAADTMLKQKPEKKLSKSQQRYKRYLEYGDMFDDFISFCYWDAEKERTWNT